MPTQRSIICDEVEKLANGTVERVPEFIERIDFASDTRQAQKEHFHWNEALKDYLQTVPEANLPTWLPAEALTASGAANIAGHVERIFGQKPPADFPVPFLQSPISLASKGVVRADMYYNSRCANRGSNPPDLLDDSLHVVQSIYCRLYVTEKPKQAEYAGLLLTPSYAG